MDTPAGCPKAIYKIFFLSTHLLKALKQFIFLKTILLPQSKNMKFFTGHWNSHIIHEADVRVQLNHF